MSEEKIKDRIEKITTRNFSITKCPERVYKRFVEFCQKETNDNYSMGLKLLIDGMDGNVKEKVLFQQYMEIKEELSNFAGKLQAFENKGEEIKSDVKTFGSKDKGDDKNEQTK